MRQLIRSSFLLLGFVLPLMVFARPVHVTSSPDHGKVFFGLTLGGFKQSNANTAYAIVGGHPQVDDIDSAPNGPLLRIPVDYHFGWGAHIGYLFPSNNDIILSVFLLDGRDNNSVSASPQQIRVTALPPAWGFHSAEGVLSLFSHEADIYQLGFGHRFFMAKGAFVLHPFFGLGVAKLHMEKSFEYLEVPAPITLENVTSDFAQVTESACFTSAGPLVGFDVVWHIWRYFSFVGNASWNLLIADVKNHYNATNSIQDLSTSVRPYDISGESHSDVISLLTFEAGLAANFMVGTTDLQVIFGYRSSEFINAVPETQFPGRAERDLMINSMRDTSFRGPFVRISAVV